MAERLLKRCVPYESAQEIELSTVSTALVGRILRRTLAE
jgi:hypothetical protein